ncbi:MAG: CotH kinase family protein [Spirosomataceae bacterium]
MKKTKIILSLSLLIFYLASCNPDKVNSDPAQSNDSAPDYETVFPQDKVNTLEISMTTTEWNAIKADMVSKAGYDFGTRATMTGIGGGMQGGGTLPTGGGTPPNGGGGTPPNGGGIQGGNAGGGALDIIPGDPIWVQSTVKFNGKEWKKVGFRLKGNSSLSQAWGAGVYKLPFKLQFDEFEDQYPETLNQRFYGFKEFSFSPGQGDNSLMRDKIVSDLFRSAGIPAARTAFYKVYIDFGSGSKYCGVYTMVEVVDDTMVENQFGEDKGNIYKPESNFTAFNQSVFEKKNNETAANWSDVQAVITALNATTRTSNAATWRANLEKVFDVDHFLKYLAINNTIVNWDSYGAMAHNYYLYTPTATQKVTWIPWDFNLSMTSSTAAVGNTQVQGMGVMGRGVSLEMTEVTAQWPLIRYLANDATYLAKYKNYLKEFTSNHFTEAKMNSIIDKHYNLIQNYVIGSEPEQTGYTYLANSAAFTSAITQLKAHVVGRNQAVAAYLK